ncbi:MAG: DUF711 family protein, partial [Chloroflexi bacterium]|nr:DUF711 family protein [Chloroflexota bacterium]
MNIRTITYFANPSFPVSAERLAAAGRATSEVKWALEDNGYTVQTVRLAGPPFAALLEGDAGKLVQYALDIEAACFVNKIDTA